MAREKVLTPAFRALADPTRLKILLMLEGKPRTVGQIVQFFNLSQPTISRHLQSLAAAGLVLRQRRGQHVYYAINPDTMRQVCLTLAACFPCCCVTVSPIPGKSGAGESKAGKPAARGRRRRTGKPQQPKTKGGVP